MTDAPRARPGLDDQITWVYTEDLDGSTQFYRDTLGFTLALDEGKARIFQVAGNSYLGVAEAFGDRSVNPDGTMITFVTDDVDGWYHYLTDRGVTVDEPPHELPQFGIYACFARDPNDYRLEFQRFIGPGLKAPR